MKNNYVLGYASNEMKRLQIQASLFESSARHFLINAGLKSGMKCMDVGCGIGNVSKLMRAMVGRKGSVLGTDIEKKYVDYCNYNNKSKNIAFVQDDILKTNVSEKFDIVYSRLMFVHLKDKLRAIKSMTQFTKKNGTIIIQELDHAPGSWLSYPDKPSVEQLRKIYVRLIKKTGGDPFSGRKLYNLFLDEGLQTTLYCEAPILQINQKPHNELGWRFALSLKPSILSNNLMTKSEFEKLIEDLKSISKDKRCFVTYARFFTIFGKKM